MMTKLRREGATQEEFNVYTRHAPGSNVVDVFYNKPVGRDLSALLLLKLIIQVWVDWGMGGVINLCVDEHEDEAFHGRQLLWGSSRKVSGWVGLWFRQKTRGNEWFLNQTKDQISYSTGFYGRNGEVATPKVGAPFTGRGSAERVVLASSKVIHH
ncbi:MAG: hypothetical protein EZS28_048698, partial [Streblomastix strix]